MTTRRWLADCFSGCGAVARAARQLGFPAKEFELRHGCDLAAPNVQRQLCQDIHQGRVLALMLAPPC
eukprot:8073291-Lingulodinium_polyedra.AAC.1